MNILKLRIHDPNLIKQYNDNLAYDTYIDLIVPKTTLVPAKSIGFRIKLNISVNIINKYDIPISSFILPKTNIYLTPIRLSCSIEIIDANYRGELYLIVDNISEKDYLIRKHQRSVQICTPGLEPIKIEILNDNYAAKL
jgi:dUTPase